MVPTPAKRTSLSFALDLSPVSDSAWRLHPEGPISQMPWRCPKPTVQSPSSSPPRPPCPTRRPPPIPKTRFPDTSVPEPEPDLPAKVLAQLVASLESGKDINNLKSSLQSDGDPSSTKQEASEAKTNQSLEDYPPPPSLHKVNTQHSHHSSKNSAPHSYAFAGGRSHKASVTSTRSSSSRRMTTEEKMSEVDAFFELDDDEEGGNVAATPSVVSCFAAHPSAERGMPELKRSTGASEKPKGGIETDV